MKKKDLKESRISDESVTSTEEAKRRFLLRLRKKLGIVSLACSLESIDEQQCRDWIRDDPVFARQVEECREAVLDFVEARMFERIDKGDARLIRFYLETQGKERGYVLRHEVNDVSMPPVILTPEESLMLERKEDDLCGSATDIMSSGSKHQHDSSATAQEILS